MNVISFEKAYCLFPRATLQNRVTAVSSDDPDAFGGRSKLSVCVHKYEERGWTFESLRKIRRSDPAFRTHRKIDDSMSWVIPLSPVQPVGSSPTQLTHDPVAICSWTHGEGDVLLYFQVLTLPTLQYAYVLRYKHNQNLLLRCDLSKSTAHKTNSGKIQKWVCCCCFVQTLLNELQYRRDAELHDAFLELFEEMSLTLLESSATCRRDLSFDGEDNNC